MTENIAGWRRSHCCGDLGGTHVGQTVTLMGWVQRSRDHGGVIFLDLRDRYGITQVVCNPALCKQAYEVAQDIRQEYVIAIQGKVGLRPEGTANSKLATGEIEVQAAAIRVLGKSKPLPFQIEDDLDTSEEVRLKYRYLDLRRPKVKDIMTLRHRVCQIVRQFLDSEGFLEIETPFLTKSTPEGARDYLVPSRVNPGTFYALPQSPQLFKQILMVAGYDKYFQIVRCFRDEDLRADRQPEFTQVDLEMSFVEQDDVMGLIERLLAKLWAEVKGETLHLPFPRLSYQDAQDRFGTDKPDTRFGLEIRDVSGALSDTECRVFRRVLDKGGVVRGFCIPGRGKTRPDLALAEALVDKAEGLIGGKDFSRRELDEMVGLAQSFGAGGLVWIKVQTDGFSSPIEKVLEPEKLKELSKSFLAHPGDVILLVADKLDVARSVLGRLRLELGRKLNLIDKSQTSLLWVVDFPWLEYNQDEGRYEALHHPFTSPRHEDLPLLDSAPEKVRAAAYDLVISGQELGGGSIRIHQPELQARMFSALGFPEEEARERFGFLLEALEYGAPPHGGIALGLDRLLAILVGAQSIREVIAFPKTQKAVCPLTSAPSTVDVHQLRDLKIRRT